MNWSKRFVVNLKYTSVERNSRPGIVLISVIKNGHFVVSWHRVYSEGTRTLGPNVYSDLFPKYVTPIEISCWGTRLFSSGSSWKMFNWNPPWEDQGKAVHDLVESKSIWLLFNNEIEGRHSWSNIFVWSCAPRSLWQHTMISLIFTINFNVEVSKFKCDVSIMWIAIMQRVIFVWICNTWYSLHCIHKLIKNRFTLAESVCVCVRYWCSFEFSIFPLFGRESFVVN